MKHSYKFWIMNIVHNILVHPLMPIADLFTLCKAYKIAQVLYTLHSKTSPTNWLF